MIQRSLWLAHVTTLSFEGAPPALIVETDRWFDARQFAFGVLGTDQIIVKPIEENSTEYGNLRGFQGTSTVRGVTLRQVGSGFNPRDHGPIRMEATYWDAFETERKGNEVTSSSSNESHVATSESRSRSKSNDVIAGTIERQTQADSQRTSRVDATGQGIESLFQSPDDRKTLQSGSHNGAIRSAEGADASGVAQGHKRR